MSATGRLTGPSGALALLGVQDPTLLKLVRTRLTVDAVEGFAEVGGQGVGGGDGVVSGLDFDGAVARTRLNWAERW